MEIVIGCIILICCLWSGQKPVEKKKEEKKKSIYTIEVYKNDT